jgi:hypothetical protein
VTPRAKVAKHVGTGITAIGVAALALVVLAIARGASFVGSSLLILAGLVAVVCAAAGWAIRFLAVRGERNRTPPQEQKLR